MKVEISDISMGSFNHKEIKFILYTVIEGQQLFFFIWAVT